MPKRVPLLLVVITQLASVLGDATGQRCSRVYHKGNRQRFLVSMTAVTSVMMLVALLFVQVALPSTADQLHKKVNGTSINVCELPHGDPHRPNDACYAQGPLTLPKMIGACPILLCNGLMNVFYYFGEATMYREPMGVLLIVMCALTSTFLVAPLQDLLGTGASKPPGAGAVIFGICGALLCSVERSIKAPVVEATAETEAATGVVASSRGGEGAGCVTPQSEELITDARHQNEEARALAEGPTAVAADVEEVGPTHDRCLSKASLARVLRVFPLVVPFAGLSVCYALYFCMMQWYDMRCNANPWGYNSVDQVALPLYMLPAMFAANLWTDYRHARGEEHAAMTLAPDSIAPTVQVVGGGGSAEHGDPAAGGSEVVVEEEVAPYETFWQAVKHSFQENAANRGEGFAFMLLYRTLINGRAISYFFIAVEYDLSEAYFVLTLVRVLLSWLVSLALVLVVPRYIRTEAAERRQLLDRANLAAKCIGSVCVIMSLLFIDGIV